MKLKNSRHPKPLAHFDESRPDFAPYGFTCESWSPRAMPRPDRHNEVELNFLRFGSLTYLLGGRRETVCHGHLTLFWAALPHQILKYEAEQPYYVATLPLVWFLGCRFPDPFVRAVLGGEIVTDPRPNPTDESAFRQWTEDLQAGHPQRERVAQMEIQTRLLRLALTLPARSRSEPQRAATRALAADPNLTRADQLACYIARHYAEPLTIERIAREVGLHPNYAMTLFRRTFGATMIDFLMRHRLSHAQRLLVTTADPIIEVAADAGFQSLSRFNEIFKNVCGCAPRTYRKTHQTVRPIPDDGPPGRAKVAG